MYGYEALEDLQVILNTIDRIVSEIIMEVEEPTLAIAIFRAALQNMATTNSVRNTPTAKKSHKTDSHPMWELHRPIPERQPWPPNHS